MFGNKIKIWQKYNYYDTYSVVAVNRPFFL